MKEVFGDSFLSYFDTPWKAAGWTVLIIVIFLCGYVGIRFINNRYEYQGQKSKNISTKHPFTQYPLNAPSSGRVHC